MIVQQLQSDQVQALKNGDKPRLETLHYILAQIRNREIEKKAGLNDDEAVAVLRKLAKELQESIGAFTKGGRGDLVGEYQAQLKVVQQYLPQEISDTQLTQAVEKILSENPALKEQKSKALIGLCVRALKDQADPARITRAVLKLLQ